MRFFRRQPEPDVEPEWLIIGLGNPGAEYSGTRHNVGYRVADRLAHERTASWNRRERQAVTCRLQIAARPVLLVKPLTFMNLSGRAVGPLARRHNVAPERILVVY